MEFLEEELDIIITWTEDVPSAARMDVMKEIIIVISHKSCRKIVILSEKNIAAKFAGMCYFFLK